MINNDKLIELITRGANYFSAVAGAALTIPGDAVSIIGGSFASVFIKNEIIDFANRHLSKQQELRVGGVAALVGQAINKRIDGGAEIRKDNFFDKSINNRAKAEELFEAVLFKSKDAFEEKKIPYMANVYVNTVFNSNVDAHNANQILNVLEQLSYRQLCLFALIGQNEHNKFSLNKVMSVQSGFSLSIEQEYLYQDLVVLADFGITRSTKGVILNVHHLAPGKVTLTQTGHAYYELLELNSMPEEEFYFLEDLR